MEENGKAKERTGGKFAQLDRRRMVEPEKELEAPGFTGAVVFNWIRFVIPSRQSNHLHPGQSIPDSFNGLDPIELQGHRLWKTWKSYPVLSLDLDHKNEGENSQKIVMIRGKKTARLFFTWFPLLPRLVHLSCGNMLVKD